jgi:hypothetical protein
LRERIIQKIQEISQRSDDIIDEEEVHHEECQTTKRIKKIR